MLKAEVKHLLTTGRIILASNSPRRLEIIQKLGLNVEVVPSKYDEHLLKRSKYSNHEDYVTDLACNKAEEVFKRLQNDEIPPTLVIAADTVVTLGDKVFGKPKDEDDAFKMLSRLNNEVHTVYTGVCLKKEYCEVCFHESTDVTFGYFTKDQIKDYIKTGEPLDKAGGYGIQGVGGCLVQKIDGDFYTVMGLPLYSLVDHLNRMDKEDLIKQD